MEKLEPGSLAVEMSPMQPLWETPDDVSKLNEQPSFCAREGCRKVSGHIIWKAEAFMAGDFPDSPCTHQPSNYLFVLQTLNYWLFI